MISILNAHKRFGSKTILDGISLELKKGETVFVLGRSGQGKSVLLKSLVGLESLDSGEVSINGVKLDREDPSALSAARRYCGLVFQNPALLDSISVLDNLLFGLRARDLLTSDEARTALVKERLTWVGLTEDILSDYPRELAFGVQKRVALLRTVLPEPQFLLFDEPTTSLDPTTTSQTNELIRRVVKGLGAGALVVSHDLRSALSMADRILLLHEGHWLFEGTPEAFRTSQTPLAVAFREGSGL